MPDVLCQDAVEGRRHDGQRDVEIDLRRHRGRARVHVEEVDGVRDSVLDHHPDCRWTSGLIDVLEIDL